MELASAVDSKLQRFDNQFLFKPKAWHLSTILWPYLILNYFTLNIAVLWKKKHLVFFMFKWKWNMWKQIIILYSDFINTSIDYVLRDMDSLCFDFSIDGMKVSKIFVFLTQLCFFIFSFWKKRCVYNAFYFFAPV